MLDVSILRTRKPTSRSGAVRADSALILAPARRMRSFAMSAMVRIASPGGGVGTIGAAGRIAVPVCVDGEDFAEFAGIVNLFGFGVEDGADALAADGDHALIFLRGLDHGESVFDEVRHGLLAIDVFAGGAGVFEDAAVVVVHGGDEDGVDILAIEDGAVVAGGGDVRVLDGFLRGDVAAVVQRSEERRVGKEGRSRWSPYHSKK